MPYKYRSNLGSSYQKSFLTGAKAEICVFNLDKEKVVPNRKVADHQGMMLMTTHKNDYTHFHNNNYASPVSPANVKRNNS